MGLLSSTGAVTEWIENTAVTGTGSASFVPKWTNTGSLENSIMISGNLTVGIGSPSPSANQYADYVLNLTTGGLRIDNDSDEKIHLRSTLSTGDVKITFNQMGNQRASVGFED